MDAAAKMTSKGQVTVPKAVRDALGIKKGDEIFFGSTATGPFWRGRLTSLRWPAS